MVLAVSASLAQSAPEPDGFTAPEAPPIQCWLKANRSAVYVGQRFNVTLTCGVLETAQMAVLPDLVQIEPATIQFPPFEVMGGVRRPDVHADSRRYIQFEYTLRVIADGFFGRDVPIPPVSLKYTLSVNSGGTMQQGRERTYLLPSIPVRVISLVPQLGGDLRDDSRNTFAEIEKRQLRSQIAMVAAAILFSFSFLYLFLTASAGVAHYRGGTARVARTLSNAAALASAARALRRARQAATSSGWNPELAAQALAGLRVAAALGLGRAVSQSLADFERAPADGQIDARLGVLRPRQVILSAAITSASMTAQLESSSPPVAPRLQAALEKLRDAIVVLSSVRYTRVDAPTTAAIDDAVDSAASGLRMLRIGMLAPLRYLDALLASAKRWSLAWTR
jgi:cell division inhibitor SulA